MGTETMSFAVLSEKIYQNILFARSACERMPSKDGQPMIELKEVSHNESEDYEITWADSALEQIMRLYLEKPEDPHSP